MNTSEGVDNLVDSNNTKNDHSNQKKVHLRKAAGLVWQDPTLDEWPENDFRIFCGNLGNEVTDDILTNAFRKYASFNKAKVIRDKRNGKTKGYGFVSLSDPYDMLDALKNMNQKFVGNRPIVVKRSRWKEREVNSKRNKEFAAFLKDAPLPAKKYLKFKRPMQEFSHKEVSKKTIDKRTMH